MAHQLGDAGRFLLSPANVAYVDAMRITTIVGALVSLLGAFVVLRWMPGKPKANVDIEEIVAAEVAAAERELAARRQLETQHQLETQGQLETQRQLAEG